MTIKRIMVPFFDEAPARAAFASAALMAKRYDAHISVIYVRQKITHTDEVYFPLGGAQSTISVDAVKEAQSETANELSLLFQSLCKEHSIGVLAVHEHRADHGGTASWSDVAGDWKDETVLLAGACDISVVVSPGEDDWQEGLVQSLLFRSGRPVYICPPSGVSALPNNIFVAWNSRPEAAHAIAAALAFMQSARVKVMAIFAQSRRDPKFADIAAYLALHGADATQDLVEVQENVDIDQQLESEIAAAGADLVVMGAYSRHRLRDLVMGSFTRRMLRQQKLAVVMMH